MDRFESNEHPKRRIINGEKKRNLNSRFIVTVEMSINGIHSHCKANLNT